MTPTTLRRFLLSTLLMTAACGSSGTPSGSGGSGGSTSSGGTGGSTSSGGAGGSAGTGGAADAGAGTSGGDASTTDAAGSDAGTDTTPQTDGSAEAAPDGASTDGATGAGTVSWTNNGTSFTVALTDTSYLQVVGTAPNAVPVVNVSGVINGTNGFPKNSISVTISGPAGDGSLPAGTYNCDKFGTKVMGATLDGAGSANNIATTGSCAVVFAAPAVNGHAISGTFTGSLIGIAGTGGTAPTNMTITAGSFSFTDTP